MLNNLSSNFDFDKRRHTVEIRDLMIMVILSMVGTTPDPEYKMTSRFEKKTVSYVKGTDLDWCLNHLILYISKIFTILGIESSSGDD